MSPRGLVVVGASAGGVEALQSFVCGLPRGLDAAVCVVLHIPRNATSVLPRILSNAGPLPAAAAEDGEPLLAGRIYVAPANLHLLVKDGTVRLSRGPTENGHRPAVDPLFRSAARAWGPNVVGVVLSGSRDDGAAGLDAISRGGGAALVQDPNEALYSSMPCRAADLVPAAQAMTAAAMGSSIEKIVGRFDVPKSKTFALEPLWEAENAMAEMSDLTTDKTGAPPVGFGCPSCHGALFEVGGPPAPRFRCRVGHSWTAGSLLDGQSDALEGALWMALRSLEEKVALSGRLATSARDRGSIVTASRYAEVSAKTHEASKIIKDLIVRMNALTDDTRTGDLA